MSKSPPPTTRWTAAGHDHLWADAANWSAGEPGAGVVARFGHGAAEVDLGDASGTMLTTGQIDVRRGSVLLSNGRLVVRHPPFERQVYSGVGLRIDDGGSLTVGTTASLGGLQTVALGNVSAATLDIRGMVSDAQVYAGRGGAVSVTVEGKDARWITGGIDQSFQFGGGAAASMVIRAGGHVGDGAAWTNPNASSTMTIGGTTAGASVLVTGRGSELRFQILDVGGSYSGTLDITAGAHVLDHGGNVGDLGDASVSVSGEGSDWTNQDGLFVHGTIPHGSVSVTDHATVRFGAYGLQLDGSFAMDGTARLVGDVVVMGGGALVALASAGVDQTVVTIGQSVELAYNVAVSGSNVGNFFGGTAGTTLVLTGQVAPQGSAYDPLAVGGGHVVLANADNGDFAMSLYGGVLEFSVAGASGTGQIAFLDDAGATLQFDQTGTIANTIQGFGTSTQEVIDLQAVAFSATPTLSLQTAAHHPQSLTVSDGAHQVSLLLAASGPYRIGGFSASDDGHGGTALTYHA